MNPGIIALMIPLFALAIGFVGVLTSHREKMAKLRFNAGEGSDNALAEEVRRLRQELDALRGASTGFDLAFDKRLDSLELRTNSLELRSDAARATEASPSNEPVQRIGQPRD